MAGELIEGNGRMAPSEESRAMAGEFSFWQNPGKYEERRAGNVAGKRTR